MSWGFIKLTDKEINKLEDIKFWNEKRDKIIEGKLIRKGRKYFYALIKGIDKVGIKKEISSLIEEEK